MRILVVSGSLKRASRTRALLNIVADSLREHGAEVDFYDLYEHRLPLYDPDGPLPAEAAEFKEKAEQADGYVFGSPEYHSGMTGALKNAIDYIGARQAKHKPVGLVVSAGGGKGGINALNNMRIVMRGIMALVVPEQVVVDKDELDADLRLTSADKIARLQALAASVARYARLIKMEQEYIN